MCDICYKQQKIKRSSDIYYRNYIVRKEIKVYYPSMNVGILHDCKEIYLDISDTEFEGN